MIGQKPCASPQMKPPTSKTVATDVELRTIPGKDGGRVIRSFQELEDGRIAPSTRFEVRVKLTKRDGFGDTVVWTETQFLFAPMARKFVSGELDPVGLVSWAWDSDFKDLKIQRVTVGPEAKEVTFGSFDLGPMFPYDPTDNLWPWALRVIVHVEPDGGPASTFMSRVYRLKPSAARQKRTSVDYDPTVPEGEPIPVIPDPCKGTELDSHPK